MTGGLRLHKLHGLGNDFLVALVDELPTDADAARTAAALCDRRRGVGADGLIYAVLDPAGGGGDRSATMRLWNSDGSPAEVSGNGLRCLAHAIAVTLGSAEFDILVETVAGPRRCSIHPTETPGTVTGTTEMGTPGPGPHPDRLRRSPEAALDCVLERFIQSAPLFDFPAQGGKVLHLELGGAGVFPKTGGRRLFLKPCYLVALGVEVKGAP